MTLFRPLVDWLYGLTGNFTVTILLTFAIFVLVASPLYFMQRAHRKKKKALLPAMQAVRAKYHASKIGFDTEHDETLDENIRAMDVNQRSEAMANELKELYAANHYHAFTGWIPGFLQYVLVILLYGAILYSIPEGSFYGDSPWQLIKLGSPDWSSPTMIMMFVVPCSQLLIELVKLFFGAKKRAVEALDIEDAQVKKKSANISTIISIVLTLGLGIWIGIRCKTAIAIGIVCLQFLRLCLLIPAQAIEARRSRTAD